MSQIPTFTSRVPIARPDESGGRAIGQALQQAGGTVGDLALALRKTHRATEFADSQARILLGVDEIATEASQISDPDAASEAFRARFESLVEKETESAGGDDILRTQIHQFSATRGAMAEIKVRQNITARATTAASNAINNLEKAILSRLETGDVSDQEVQMLRDGFTSTLEAQVGLTHTPESAQARLALFDENVRDKRESQITNMLGVGANKALDREGADAGATLGQIASGAVARGLPVEQAVKATVDAVARRAITEDSLTILETLEDARVGGARLLDYQIARDEFDSAAQEIATRRITRDNAAWANQGRVKDERTDALQSAGIAMILENPNADTRDIESSLGANDLAGLSAFLTLKSKMQADQKVKDDPLVSAQLTVESLDPTPETKRNIIDAINSQQLSTGTGISLYNQATNSMRVQSEDPFWQIPQVRDAKSTAEGLVIRGIAGSDLVEFSKETAIQAQQAKAELQAFAYDLRSRNPELSAVEFSEAINKKALDLVGRYNPEGINTLREMETGRPATLGSTIKR